MASAEGQVAKVRVSTVQLVFQAARHAPVQLVVVEKQLCQVGEAAQPQQATEPSLLTSQVWECPRASLRSRVPSRRGGAGTRTIGYDSSTSHGVALPK